MEQPDAITRLFRACDPSQPLGPKDPRYVNLDEVRGDSVVQVYERSLRRADPTKPEVKLFAGHRGVGKTSELLRLKQMLEYGGEGKWPFLVVYMDVTESLDVNDLDFPDLLVFVAAEAQKQLKAANIPEFNATTQYLSRVWEDLKRALEADVKFKGGEVGVGLAKLGLELRNRPNARHELRGKIEKMSSSLLGAVNDLLESAMVSLRKAGKQGLVLIVDGLDKLVLRPLKDEKTTTHDRLFIGRSEQLASLKAHTIYTVPISLFYSTQCAQLEQTLGEFNTPVNMIKLHGEGKTKLRPESPGMRKMREIFEARCKSADVKPAEVFDSEDTFNYLAEMTGGHPRHLMMFLQSAMNEIDALPITHDAAERAIRKYANSLVKEIPDAFWPALRKFDTPQDDIPKDEIHQQMLFFLHVFAYINGHPWYEVNPVIRTIHRFRENSGDPGAGGV